MENKQVRCPFLEATKWFRICAEQSSNAKSQIIYLLFVNRKMHFFEIVNALKMSSRHISRVLFQLKAQKIVDSHEGMWFLTE